MQNLKWFKEREMDTVIMVTLKQEEKEVYIADETEAKYYCDLQQKGFEFKAKEVIQKEPPGVCLSCEG